MGGSGFAGRMEVLPEPGGRRAWPLETKLRIVAESYAAGTTIGEVARRHGLLANQVTCWRRLYRRGELVPRGSPPLPPIASGTAGSPPMRAASADLPAFVPLVLDEPEAAASRVPEATPELGVRSSDRAGDRIEVEAGGVVVRLPGDVDPLRLAAIAAALRDTGRPPA